MEEIEIKAATIPAHTPTKIDLPSKTSDPEIHEPKAKKSRFAHLEDSESDSEEDEIQDNNYHASREFDENSFHRCSFNV